MEGVDLLWGDRWFMEEVMPKFASSRTCGSQIGRNGGKWRVGGHGHQVAEEGE